MAGWVVFCTCGPRRADLLHSDAAVEQVPRLLSGIGQVFDLRNVTPRQLLEPSRVQPVPPLNLITLWGDGRINLRRASAAAVKLALTPTLTSIEVNRLIEARSAPISNLPVPIRDPLARLLAQANVSSSVAGRGLPVTLVSACHSVWVIDNDGRRQWHELEVLDRSDADHPRRSFFSW